MNDLTHDHVTEALFIVDKALSDHPENPTTLEDLGVPFDVTQSVMEMAQDDYSPYDSEGEVSGGLVAMFLVGFVAAKVSTGEMEVEYHE